MNVAAHLITQRDLLEQVEQMGEQHPPIPLDSVDRTLVDADRTRRRFGSIIEFLARVELQVERNVRELHLILPNAPDSDVAFYRDVWRDQEVRHGQILDGLQRDLGMGQSQPALRITWPYQIVRILEGVPGIEQVARLLYYLTGATTEKSAVLAYSRLHNGLLDAGESAVARTIIGPIRRQEPCHFSFYKRSAQMMIQDRVLAPWQMFLARLVRRNAYTLVGAETPDQIAALGGVVLDLGLEHELSDYVAQISQVEWHLLWAKDQGMRVPAYAIDALGSAVERFKAQGHLSSST